MILRTMFLLNIFFLSFLSPLHATQKLTFGIFPYTDALQIIKIYQPLRQYLEKELDAIIEIYTAPNFEQFFIDTQKGLFDFVVAPPHFSPIHIEQGYVPLLRYNRFLAVVYVVKKESTLMSVHDFKFKTIALPNHLSISSISGLTELSHAGLKNGETFQTIYAKTHAAAVQSVLFGESDAAITTHTALKQMENNFDLSHLRFIESAVKMPHLFILSNPKLSPLKQKHLKEALLHFEKTHEGEDFFTTTGYHGYIEPSQEDYTLLAPFVDETKKILKQ